MDGLREWWNGFPGRVAAALTLAAALAWRWDAPGWAVEALALAAGALWWHSGE